MLALAKSIQLRQNAIIAAAATPDSLMLFHLFSPFSARLDGCRRLMYRAGLRDRAAGLLAATAESIRFRYISIAAEHTYFFAAEAARLFTRPMQDYYAMPRHRMLSTPLIVGF